MGRRSVRAGLWLLLVLGLLGALDTLCYWKPVERALARARAEVGTPPIAPHGTLDLQLTPTADRARRIVEVWRSPTLPEEPGARPEGLLARIAHRLEPAELAASYREWIGEPLRARLRTGGRAGAGRAAEEYGRLPACFTGGSLLPCARESLRLDWWLIAFYVPLLIAGCLLVSGAFPEGRRRDWYLFATTLPLLTGLLDALENDRLAQLIEGGYRLAPWTWLAAAQKFGLLLAVVFALLIVGVARLMKSWNTTRTRPAEHLATVVGAERRYLGQRRRKARVPLDGPAIGLALSGGGIRSATLNLGVLQALARRRVLPYFDYLTTVSGGGYIGSCLSSLLSINEKELAESAAGRDGQYVFEKGDEPLFSTAHDAFPFDDRDDRRRDERRPDGAGPDEPRAGGHRLDGAAQMRHLRAAGEFLVGRRQLISVEMLRAVGSVSAGILLHLLHFGLFLVMAAAFYLCAIYFMAGKRATRFAGAESLASGDRPASALGPDTTPLLEQYRDLLNQAFGLAYQGELFHPFAVAALVGFVTTALSLLVARGLLRRLPDDWFARTGMTLKEARNLVAVIALAATMAAVGFFVLVPWYRASLPDDLLNISIPLMSYLGGGAFLILVHVVVKASRRFGRSQRSRLAAQEGALVVLLVLSVVLVMAILPFLVFFDSLVDYLEDRPVRSVVSWLVTLFGARFLAGGEPDTRGKGAAERMLSAVPGLRKLLLSLAVFVAVLGGWLLFCVLIWNHEPEGASGIFRIGVFLGALVLFLLTGLLDFNRLALHFFYRDRLVEAYLRTTSADPARGLSLAQLRNSEGLRLEQLHGRRRRAGPEECVTGAPYHLLVTCLNLSSDERPSQATRKSDQFLFSRLYCGSETTGFQESWSYRAGDTQLADAMTISGAAASPAMGRSTFFAQSVAMTLFNVRLGQWMENPAWVGGTQPRRTFWPGLLAREILGSVNADGRLVYLSDGGHSGDNVGIYPLLKRRCKLILAVDAEEDSGYASNSLAEALRQIRIDEGITVDIDLAPLRPAADRPSRAHFVCGRIHYPPRPGAGGQGGTRRKGKGKRKARGDGVADAESGTLIVIKSSLTGDESELIANYRRNNAAFPHQSTGDLFFDDAQFEAYRELGEHMVGSMLDSCPACSDELPPLADRS